MAKLLFLLISLLGVCLGAGESRPTHFLSLWDQGRLVRFNPTWEDAAWIYGPKGSIRKIPMPRQAKVEFKVVDWFDGALWANRFQGGGLEVWKFGESSWERVAVWRPEEGTRCIPNRILPLAQDHFLAFVCCPLFQDNGRLVPVVTLGLRQGTEQLQLRSFTDIGLETEFIPRRAGGKDFFLEEAFWMPMVVRIGDLLVLPLRKWGCFIIFDGQTGRHRRTVRLFSDLPEKELFQDWPLQALLGFQGTEHDELVFAARQRDAVFQSKAFLTEVPMGEGGIRNPAVLQSLISTRGKDQKVLDEVFSQVNWYALEPRTGKIREIAPPKGAHTSLKSVPTSRDFNWRITWKGEVEFYSDKAITEVHYTREAETMTQNGEPLEDYLKAYLPKPQGTQDSKDVKGLPKK